MNAVLDLSTLPPKEREKLDLTKPVSGWTNIKTISKGLVLNYARVLDQAPAGQPEDYLVWEAVNVVGRYADPTKTPAAEHIAVAALAIEGVASDIATANWDGLVEKAVEDLAGTAGAILQVRVRPEDVRDVPARAYLYKFHGCAVLAGQNAATYRPRVVGRASQINGWDKKAENRVFARKLIDLVISKRTLMLGLSAQDANIQTIFVAAREDMAWEFPSTPPAFVFSEEQIGVDQRGLLRNVYKDQYTPHQAAIDAEALLRAYGRSLLPALWLHVVCAKLSAMIPLAAPGIVGAERGRLDGGLRRLRDAVAETADPMNHDGFITTALNHAGKTLTLFREGRGRAAGEGAYSPISKDPIAATLEEPGLGASGLRQFAFGLGLLGVGEESGAWTCAAEPGDTAALKLTGAVRTADVFFAANSTAAINLVLNGHVAFDQDAVVLHSHPVPPAAARSPSGALGRTGRLGLREINLAELADGAVQVDDVVARLKAEMVL